MRGRPGQGGKGNRLLSLSWRPPAGAGPRGGQKPWQEARMGRRGRYHFYQSAIALLGCQALSPGMSLQKYAQRGGEGQEPRPIVKITSFCNQTGF